MFYQLTEEQLMAYDLLDQKYNGVTIQYLNRGNVLVFCNTDSKAPDIDGQFSCTWVRPGGFKPEKVSYCSGYPKQHWWLLEA